METIRHICTEVWFFVLVFGGYLQGSVIAAFALVALVVTPTRLRGHIWKRFFTFLSFNIGLLIAGGVGCAIWAVVAYPRWYVEADPVVTYQPLLPFGQWVLDATFGSFHGYLRNGASVVQLQVLWCFLTLAVWSSAFLLHRTFLRASGRLLNAIRRKSSAIGA